MAKKQKRKDSISFDKEGIRFTILQFDQRIDKMHEDFMKYRHGEIPIKPDLERLERELMGFSRRKIFELELSSHLDNVLFKLQNRKKIWLTWVEEIHGGL